ncbi:MAG TPA: alpha/beta fold hydrolase [Ilumatobacter sp.]|nr:alpha/beta fold hydrolase [Ilumatobacter sp.]
MRFVFLHGFTQTHHHWHGPAEAVRAAVEPSATLAYVDLPGHGLAGADRSGISPAGVELAALGGPGTWVGYSMGGRFALHAALAPSHQIERLVLVGATAGLTDPAERAARVAEDETRAGAIEANGVDAFLDRWLAAPLFATLPPHPDGLEHRRRNTADGLAHSLRTAGTGAQESLWERLDEIDIPVLCLAGELDTKFTALGRELAAALPRGEFATVPGAGHAAHTERPTELANLIAGWLTG